MEGVVVVVGVVADITVAAQIRALTIGVMLVVVVEVELSTGRHMGSSGGTTPVGMRGDRERMHTDTASCSSSWERLACMVNALDP